MKIKYVLKVAAAVALICTTSCTDYLDKEPDTEVTIDEVFTQKVLQERWLAHCYSIIPDPYWWCANESGWDIMGDDLCPSERWRQWGWFMIPRRLGDWNTSTGWWGNYWSNIPMAVRDCLIFQQRATPVPAEGLSSKEVQLMKAETRFLIAYYYSLMLTTYGPFPFTPGQIYDTSASFEEMNVGQSPFDDIAAWIDNELLEVSKILPARYTETYKYGRATSIMCLAVRARLALFCASPLVNGNPDYANHLNRDGVPLFNSTYEPKKWVKAAEACKLLIDEAHANGHKLYVEYNDDGSIDPYSSYQNLFLPTVSTDCPEILFARVSVEAGNWQKHCATSAQNGYGGLGVTQEYVDAFFMNNGLPAILGYNGDGSPIINTESGYVDNGFSKSDQLAEVKWEAGEPTGNPNIKKITAAGTYNMYVNREPRFYVSVNFNGGYYPNAQRHLDMLYKHADNQGTHDAPQNGYLNRKRVHPDYVASPNIDFYRPGILYRLGEAYLNYAEALNEAGQSPDLVLLYINKIRERAGIRQYTSGATDEQHIHVNASDKDEMRRIIKAERRVELGCEGGLRYDDLRRWKDAEQYLNGFHHGMNYLGTTAQEFFKRTECQSKRVYKKAFYWMPIHQDEIDKNPKLVQAPYWETAN